MKRKLWGTLAVTNIVVGGITIMGPTVLFRSMGLFELGFGVLILLWKF